MGNMNKARVGKSGKMKDSMPEPAGLGKLHKSGHTIPTFNSPRMDKMEKMGPKSSPGVKKK
jgi:hypothetical protein